MFFCDVCCGRVGPQAASLRKRLLRGVLRLALCERQLATVGDLDWRFIVEACEQVSQLVPTSSLCRDVVFRHVFSVCRSRLEFRRTTVELRWKS